ncbi:MAG: hypothetical protein KDC53_13685, partial [Saprospiraceae bacterium]|nr:hypothetical protein [Saprospiraceae bacterium]
LILSSDNFNKANKYVNLCPGRLWKPTMKDENQLASNPPQATSTHNSNILHDWWEEIYPRDFLLTFKNYLFNHKQFFDEVFDEKWDNKVKPMAFLFTAIGLSLIIGSISPWGLTFFDEPPKPESWNQITTVMDSEDHGVFKQIFGLQDLNRTSDTILYNQLVEDRLKMRLGTANSPTTEDLQSFFEEEGYSMLAKRAEYINLKSLSDHNQKIKSQELTEIEQIIMINLLVFYAIFFWLVSHQFFSKAQRSARETVMVYMYGLGMLIFFVWIPFLASAGTTNERLPSYLHFIILAILIFLIFKFFSIFRYTHHTGFYGMILIFVKTFFWPIFMIPILIRWLLRKMHFSN